VILPLKDGSKKPYTRPETFDFRHARHHQMRKGIKRSKYVRLILTCKMGVEKETSGNKRALFD
jgi:hypothetical protein